MSKFSVIDAPSILGLRPTGVEHLPEALKKAGLLQGLEAEYDGQVPTLPYSEQRDLVTLVLNPEAIRSYSLSLAEQVERVLASGRWPIVLGGDCSVLIGNLLALNRRGRYGLVFMDGHADFYQPEASPTGEVADMELAIVSGRGPEILTNIEGRRPLVQDQDIAVLGFRDVHEYTADKSEDVRDTRMCALDLWHIRKMGVHNAAQTALYNVLSENVLGFWIHLDVDVLDDAIMPAVDYRLAGGLQFTELSELLKVLFLSGSAVGMDITIFNPALDSDGSIARNLVSSIVAGLS
jgi:arginase